MTPDEIRRRACLSLLIILILLFDGFLLAFGHYIELNVDIRPEPLDILRAQGALLAAWLVFGTEHRAWRTAWCAVGLTAVWTLAMKYRADTFRADSFEDTVRMTIANEWAALFPCLTIFMVQRWTSGFRLVVDRTTSLESADRFRFRLRDILLMTTACAVTMLIVRSVSQHRFPAMLSSIGKKPLIGPEAIVTVGSLSFIPGLFIGPCALCVLKPSRAILVWVVCFVLISALVPFLEVGLTALVTTPPPPPPGPLKPPPDWLSNYLRAVADNLWWYGTGLLPTAIGFLLLRGSGVRVRETVVGPLEA